jgi:hypothetical protein
LAVENDKENIRVIGEQLEITFLTPEERAKFVEKCQPVYEWFRGAYPRESDNLDQYIAEIARLANP